MTEQPRFIRTRTLDERAPRRQQLRSLITAIRQHQNRAPVGPRLLRAGIGGAVAFIGASLLIDAVRTLTGPVMPAGSGFVASMVGAMLAAAWVLRRSPVAWSWAEEAGRLLADYPPRDAVRFRDMLDELRAQSGTQRGVPPSAQQLEPVLRWAYEELETLREAPRAPSAWDRLLGRRA